MTNIGNGNQKKNRVVVTGIGVVSPIGKDMPTTWQGLVNGKSGIDNITLFDTTHHETKFAGEVKSFDPSDYVSRKEARRMDRFAQLAVAASLEAAQQAVIKPGAENQYNIGVIIGSGIGGLTSLFDQSRVLIENGPDRISPFLAPMMMGNAASAQVSMVLGIKGRNFCTTSACSSGADAIGTAYEIINNNYINVMLAGGADAIINPIGVAAFNACKAISTRNDDPPGASRPFDTERDGFVIGEGAAVLVMENLDYALSRGAEIIGEVVGYGATGDAFHITQPREDGEGATRAIQMALAIAGREPADIDYINAHGTSTPINDKVETMAIKRVFGDRAYKVPISSTKSMTGHLIGGAGAIEAAISLMVIRNGIIPPTINLTHPDPDCDLDYVPNAARRVRVTTAMSNSFGFGGHNSVLVFRKYTEG
jgi:3-oxoacyl-[acyl-carrier-protein] synthase II